MDQVFKVLLAAHIAAGFTSLGLFFVPMFARKGGKLHNRAGRWYTYGMWTVIVTALLMCGIRSAQGYMVQAAFLGFLALLTARPLYYAIAVIRHKRTPSARMRRIDFSLRLALAITSPVMIYLGLSAHGLLVAFGILGTLVIPSIVRDLRGKVQDYNWLEEHLSGMLISAIAAFTAFFSFGGRRIFGEALAGNLEIVVWLAPTVLGVAIIRWHKRRLRRGSAA
ncbi:MAG: hypothetical protein AAFZ52_17165 [Bacteroidota bacterium]